jgi:hypothetical protein
MLLAVSNLESWWRHFADSALDTAAWSDKITILSSTCKQHVKPEKL